MGRIISIIAAIGLINSFYMPWYKFPGIDKVTPIDVWNYCMSQPFTSDNLFRIASIAGILVLAGLMIFTFIFKKLYLSVLKLIIALFLVMVHVGYFYSNILQSSTPFEWLNIAQTSSGFLLFIGAMALYFISVILSIIFSPLRGAAKLVGL